ncbi:MAG: N-acetylmuramoyl-L-alanine amidase [Candidatus Peregrinibacteria bacterium]|nr:N-acetylmuramoyl-L-alanine amidase [Candidatus Peregrinibacteria bacterium]
MRQWILPILFAFAAPLSSGMVETTVNFGNPIDALSIQMDPSAQAEVSGWDGERWTAWEPLAVETEFDPLLRESNLILFPRAVTQVRLRGAPAEKIHPITVSNEPARTLVAATKPVATPRILSRSAWGADDSLLLVGDESSRSDLPDKGDNGATDSSTSSVRVRDCEEAQKLYPQEFKSARTVTENGNGKKFRWAQQYSKDVRLLVVHHTAMKVSDETRSGLERIRALYQFHANSRGWGDIGYHYIIDEEGQIYEGRAGGDYVVGGHVYCSNVGTVGVALMGNFDLEKPTQEQVHSLQWLLDTLAKQYDIDTTEKVTFHGKSMPPIVGHRALVSTDCPGYYVWETLSQLRINVANGDLDTDIRFPSLARRSPSTPKPGAVQWLSAIGSTDIEGRPGGEVTIDIAVAPDGMEGKKRPRAVSVKRSDTRLAVWQEKDGAWERLRTSLPLKGSDGEVRLRVQLPRTKGSSTLTIGDLTFTLGIEGRRLRTVQTPTRDPPAAKPRSTTEKRVSLRPRQPSSASSEQSGDDHTIRIRLTYTGDAATLRSAETLRINGADAAGDVTLTKEGTLCRASGGGKETISESVRIEGGIITIVNSTKATNRFRGVIECRVVDGALTLINELPLEEYLWGLAEEPDTEPYEKQRAFAIAARTYALFYLDPLQRKFPGKPYDGSDSPATFQAYGGVVFEEQNPRWVKAVDETKATVLTKNGTVIKPPYFSSDDGRTRSPAEAGWKDFPFAEVFASKPDPWCVGKPLAGHGVGMSGCGSEGQAEEGKTAEEILSYYYPTTALERR